MGLFEIFAYPVSGLLKLWHLLFNGLLGFSVSTAWVLSLFGLVLTVRALIAPFSWMQIRAGRLGVLMRPHLRKLAQEYAQNRTPEGLAKYRQAQKDLRKEYGYNPAAGCLPLFIQIPVFLGLYRVLIRIARPVEGVDASSHPHIGFLSPEDVSSFLASEVSGVPLPAFRLLGDERLAAMGTTPEAVQAFIAPFVIAACCFAFVSMLISSIRNRNSLDYTSGVSIVSQRIVYIMMIMGPLLLATAGFSGAIPVAIAMYWVAGNCWTLLQSAVIYFLIWKKYPYPPEHFELQRTTKAEAKERIKEKRRHKRLRRKALVSKRAKQEHLALVAKQTEEKEQRARERAEARAVEREYAAQQREARQKAKLNSRQAEQKEAAQPDHEPSGENRSSDSDAHQLDHHQGKPSAAEPE